MARRRFERRELLGWMSGMGGSAVLSGLTSCRKEKTVRKSEIGGRPRETSNEEYVWLSCNTHLPIFVGHDHPALQLAAAELGVKTTIAGPDSLDIPGLVATIEQTTARRPAGMMVVGWNPSALIQPINKAVDSGVPVVCVDADVPGSKRLAFIGTDWYDLGVKQGRAMLAALNGRKGKVAMLGLIEQYIDQQAFAGFRTELEKSGVQTMEPQQDRGNQAEAARIATAILQATPDLVGIAGFGSESGPGIALAIRETGKTGKLVATCVDAEEQHLEYLKEGALSALIMQKRELFTYYGVKLLFDAVHSPVKLSKDDKKAGVSPIPLVIWTGTVTITRDNLHFFLDT